MTCLEIRDRLTEHALGLLSEEEAADVERHLDWCAGCRKEAQELQEAVASVGFSLPPATPPRGLAERVVDHVAGGTARGRESGGGPSLRRRAARSLVATAMAAVLVATGAVGWAVAERHTAQTRQSQLNSARALANVIARLGGQPFRVQLQPASFVQTSGFAVLVTGRGNNFVFVDILPPSPDAGPYSVQLFDSSSHLLYRNQLAQGDTGDLFVWDFPGHDLSNVASVSVLDRSGDLVLTGTVTAFSKG